MRSTSTTVAISSLTAPTFITFNNDVSRHFEMWLSGTSPSNVYFNFDEYETTVDDTAAALTAGIKFKYQQLEALTASGSWLRFERTA